MQGLERDLDRRYACADDFANELRKFLKLSGYGRSRQSLKDFLRNCFGHEIDSFNSDLSVAYRCIDENCPAETLEDLIVEAKMAGRSGSQELMPVSGYSKVSRLNHEQNLVVSQSVLIGLPTAGVVVSQQAQENGRLQNENASVVESQGENQVKKRIIGDRR